MDLKSMLVAAAEAQADKVKDDMMSALNSKEMEEKIASAINAKINLPFIPEDKEQELFEKVVDVVTDLLAGLFEGKQMPSGVGTYGKKRGRPKKKGKSKKKANKSKNSK